MKLLSCVTSIIGPDSLSKESQIQAENGLHWQLWSKWNLQLTKWVLLVWGACRVRTESCFASWGVVVNLRNNNLLFNLQDTLSLFFFLKQQTQPFLSHFSLLWNFGKSFYSFCLKKELQWNTLQTATKKVKACIQLFSKWWKTGQVLSTWSKGLLKCIWLFIRLLESSVSFNRMHWCTVFFLLLFTVTLFSLIGNFNLL